MNVDKPLLAVLERRRVSRRPVWLMRQAGRYLPEYRALRAEAGSFLELCYRPDLAAEVTLQPLRRFDLDAAILFSDILVVPHAMGLALDFVEGEGPQLETATDLGAVQRLGVGEGSEKFDRVYETVARVRENLDGGRALIGFCGGAWTVASYVIEGGSSDRKLAVAAAVENPSWFALLIDRIVEASVGYLCGQVEAGAEALQIFDSWAGEVPEHVRERVVFEPSRRMIAGVRARFPDIPIILFARGLGRGHGLAGMNCGANAVGVEQGVNLSDVLAESSGRVAVQGNLAPELLLADPGLFGRGVDEVLRSAPMDRHIFNLGHGITPQVAPERVTELLSLIRTFDGGGSAHV